jgi:hypothetical protein
MTAELSQGAIFNAYSQAGTPGGTKLPEAVVQVVVVKKMESQAQSTDRYKLVLSDGITYITGTLIILKVSYVGFPVEPFGKRKRLGEIFHCQAQKLHGQYC